MRRITMMGALVAVLATSALAAETASAKSLKLDLTHEFGTIQIKPGDEFNLVTHEFTIATSAGNVECSTEGSILGTDLTNDAKTDKVELKSATGSLYGAPPRCITTFGYRSNEALISMYTRSGPWTLSLGSNGKAEFKANTNMGIVEVHFVHYVESRCYYTFTKLKGSVNASPSLAVVEIKFSKQKLKLEAFYSAGSCPKTATLTVPFTYSLTNNNQEYIFEHIHS